MRILAIDDNADNLVSVEALLRACLPGCETSCARSGPEGIEKARELQPDTILLDVRMPGMDGFEACRILKQDPATRHIPVVFLTAQQGDAAARIHGLEIGGDAFLTKPVEAGELTAQVRAMVRIKKAEDALRTEKITLERAVEERTRALRESEERFRVLFENAPVGYQSLDGEGRFIVVNEAWLALLGYPREEVLGRWFGDFLVPEYREHFCANFPRFKERGEIRGVEFRMRRRDGSTILAAFEGKIGHDGEGRFRQTHCVLHDVTEQRRAQESVEESRRTLRSMIDGISEAVFLAGRDGELVVVNETFATRVGRRADECAGLPIWELVPEELAESRRARFEEVVRTGRPLTFEDRRGERWTRHSLFPQLDADGRVTRIAGFAVDVTELRRSEEALMDQLDELRRWHAATLGREGRILELKQEVNELLAEAGRAPRYASALEMAEAPRTDA
ncbi:MAG: PAS domain S-box protein [Thermoanaerobaculia bacterium]